MAALTFFVLSAFLVAGSLATQSQRIGRNHENEDDHLALKVDADIQAANIDASDDGLGPSPVLAMVFGSNGEARGDSMHKAAREWEDAGGGSTFEKSQNAALGSERQLLSFRRLPQPDSTDSCSSSACQTCSECMKTGAQSSNCGGLWDGNTCIDPNFNGGGGTCKTSMNTCGKNSCVKRALCSSPCICNAWKSSCGNDPTEDFNSELCDDFLGASPSASNSAARRRRSAASLESVGLGSVFQNSSDDESGSMLESSSRGWVALQRHQGQLTSKSRGTLDVTLQDKCSG